MPTPLANALWVIPLYYGTDLGTLRSCNANPRGLEFEGKAQLFCIILVAVTEAR